MITQIFSLVLLLAGAGAYVCCLWSWRNPLRKWAALVIAPGALGVLGGVFLPAVIVVSQRGGSVLEKFNPHPHSFWDLKIPRGMLLLNLGSGFRLAVLGLFLALVTAVLLHLGEVSVPLQFGRLQAPESSGREPESARFRQKLFTLYVLAFPWFGANLLLLLIAPFFNRFVQPLLKDGRTFANWLNAAQYLLLALTFFLVAAWCIGQDRRNQLRQAARFPNVKWLGLGALIGAAAFFLPHVVAYAIDRVAWAQHWGGPVEAPAPLRYLHVFSLGPYLILTAIASALSEWCWRGCAQPQLVRIFGIPRGLFLLGLLYGSVQQIAFPRFFTGLPEFFFNFLLMLISGIAWSVVFGWLTIRASSVWPAALCSAVINVLLYGSFDDTTEMIPRRMMRLGLLLFAAAVALLLVRYAPLCSRLEEAVGPEAPPLPESA